MVRLERRTDPQRLDWLTWQVALLTARLGACERALGIGPIDEEDIMGDDDRRELENTLLSTDDAQVWAEEFCRIFNGRTIVGEDTGGTDDEFVDLGTMTGWFANAMQTAVNQYERKKMRDDELRRVRATEGVPETAREKFVEGFTDGREEPEPA